MSLRLKLVFALVLDSFPVLKRHFKPWFIFAAIFGVVSYGLLGVQIQGFTTTYAGIVTLLALVAACQAMMDVLVDGLVVKNARKAGSRGAVGLQSFCWVLYYLGSLIGNPVTRQVGGVAAGNTRSLMLYVFAPVSVVLLGLAVMLREEASKAKWGPMLIVKNAWKLVKGVLFNFKVLLPVIFMVLRGLVIPDISGKYSLCDSKLN
jgi:hypothetical protein